MKRLTKIKSIHNNKPEFYEANIDLYPKMMGYEHQLAEMDCIDKLGQLEDLMESFKINSIEQLINILEAWEICKKHSHINNYDSNNKRFDITIWLNTENCDFKSCASFEECLKVKKTLEVEENES